MPRHQTPGSVTGRTGGPSGWRPAVDRTAYPDNLPPTEATGPNVWQDPHTGQWFNDTTPIGTPTENHQSSLHPILPQGTMNWNAPSLFGGNDGMPTVEIPSTGGGRDWVDINQSNIGGYGASWGDWYEPNSYSAGSSSNYNPSVLPQDGGGYFQNYDWGSTANWPENPQSFQDFYGTGGPDLPNEYPGGEGPDYGPVPIWGSPYVGPESTGGTNIPGFGGDLSLGSDLSSSLDALGWKPYDYSTHSQRTRSVSTQPIIQRDSNGNPINTTPAYLQNVSFAGTGNQLSARPPIAYGSIGYSGPIGGTYVQGANYGSSPLGGSSYGSMGNAFGGTGSNTGSGGAGSPGIIEFGAGGDGRNLYVAGAADPGKFLSELQLIKLGSSSGGSGSPSDPRKIYK